MLYSRWAFKLVNDDVEVNDDNLQVQTLAINKRQERETKEIATFTGT